MFRWNGDFEWVFNARRAVNRQPGDRAVTRRADTPEHQKKSIKKIKLVGLKQLKLTQKSIRKFFFYDLHLPEPSQIHSDQI